MIAKLKIKMQKSKYKNQNLAQKLVSIFALLSFNVLALGSDIDTGIAIR